MATSISKTSVAVGMDASAFKTGAESLKGYFKDIGASAGKLVGVLGLTAFTIGGIKAGIEGSLGKVVAFEKTQAILEAIGTSAGSSKESIANLVSTLSAITGRNDEAGKALGDMARKMMSVGFSAAETDKLVTSFYKTAKSVPGEMGQTVGMLEKMAIQMDEMGFVELGQFKALAELGLPIIDIFAEKISEMRGVVVSTDEVVAQLKLAQQTGGASGITTQEQLQIFAGLGDSKKVQAQAEAVGNTFAGAMGKAKGEISLLFFEIGKAINAFFGGTKTYVSLFQTITAGVKAAREQVELLTLVFANNRQWIEDFKNGIDILVVAFFRGFEVMGQQLVESGNLIADWFGSFVENIPAMENALGGFFSSAASMASNFFSSIGSGFNSAISGIRGIFTDTISGGVGLITGSLSMVGGLFVSIAGGFKSLLNTLTFGLSNAIGGFAVSVMKFTGWLTARFFEAYYNIFKGLAGFVGSGIAYVVTGFASLFGKIVSGLASVIGSVVGPVVKFAGWIGARFAEAYYNIFKGLLNFITMGFSNKVIDSISGIASSMTSAFVGVISSVTSAISGSASAIGGFFTSATKPVEDTTGAIKGMATATDTGTERVSYMQAIFKGFGEYMTDFSNNFQAIFSVWDVLMESFGDGVSNVTNIWEGMYEIIQTIKTAAQVGFLVIYELGVKSVNGVLKVFEDMAAFTTKWIDKFSYGLSSILESIGLVSKGTTDAMLAQDKARGNVGYNLGRFDAVSPSEARQNIQNQAEEERRARIKMYNERKLGLNKDLPTAENPDFARGKGGSGGAQLAAPTLLSAGGAEEYKLIVERNNAKLMDGAKKTNDLLEQANGHLETIAGNRPIAPATTVVPMIPRG